ncbi:GAF domain-containing protein [Pseudarthrobacter defluvii]|uniref:GAF and ANTAR domain-containing protein n=1 Tax=Pseudarthrobacter defluvii TaxID=410837 RepID=UPI002786360F|nr:GAF and ANTAR domain-containing protein [Pseudarthrobacter defluvii]MDQ0769317.1 GAF domain-containing protein [Pseudarthrobacter defluvii]
MNSFLPQAYELAGVTGKMITCLLTEEEISKAVQSLSYVLKDMIPNAAGVGASIISPSGRSESTGATDPVVLVADKLQYEAGEGPCLSAWAEQRPVIIQDTQEETRWPTWTAAVTDLPIRSVLSAPLSTGGRHLGALKVYSPLPLAFDDNTVFLIERLAGLAAVLLGHTRDRQAAQRMNAELAQALVNRDMISKAQGILIERMNLDSQEALDVLLARSRGESTPLHEVARDVLQQPLLHLGGLYEPTNT